MSARLAPPAATPYLVAVVAGAMAFLAVCALSAGQGAASLVGFWQADLSGTATIRLAPEDDAAAAIAALDPVPGVTGATLLSREAVAALLLPWLGALPDEAAIPLPQIIDVTLATPPPARTDVEAALPPGAVYDDHRAWTAPLREAVAGFERLIMLSVGLSGVALAAMVVVAARASLAGAADTVQTLRLLGARDGFIAASFDRGIGLRAALGAAVGAPLAVALVQAIPQTASATAVPWPVLLALPVVAGALAWLTARLAILLMLRGAP